MEKKTENLLFIIVICICSSLTAFLHFYDLGNMPPGIHVDEASVAYNAFSIIKTGRDEHGVKYPIFFKAFSNYQDPVLVYSLIPFIYFFGLEKWSARLPSGIYHILASIAVYFLIRRFVRNRWIALVCSFSFSLLPWIFPISRTCIGGYTPLLLGFAGGLYFFFDFIDRKKIISAILAAFFLAFAIYSHHPGRPLAAILILCIFISYNSLLIKRIRLFSLFIITLGILTLPMVIYVLGNPSALTTRFKAISVWRDDPETTELIFRILYRYIEYFSPQFLFISGDSNYAHSTQKTGSLFIFLAPLVVLGFIHILKHLRRNPKYRLIFVLTLTYPTAAALTIGHRHGTACIVGSIYWIVIASLGAKKLLFFRKYKNFTFLAIAALAFMEIPIYFKDYFCEYRNNCRWIFNASSYEAVEKAFELRQDNETIHISRFFFFPVLPREDFKPEFYIILLFLGKIDPYTYQKDGIPSNIVRLYSYPPQNGGILIRLDRLILTDEQGSPYELLHYEEEPQNLSLLWTFPTPSGISLQIKRFKL